MILQKMLKSAYCVKHRLERKGRKKNGHISRLVSSSQHLPTLSPSLALAFSISLGTSMGMIIKTDVYLSVFAGKYWSYLNIKTSKGVPLLSSVALYFKTLVPGFLLISFFYIFVLPLIPYETQDRQQLILSVLH